MESVNDALDHDPPCGISRRKSPLGRVIFVLCNYTSCRLLGLVAAGLGNPDSSTRGFLFVLLPVPCFLLSSKQRCCICLLNCCCFTTSALYFGILDFSVLMTENVCCQLHDRVVSSCPWIGKSLGFELGSENTAALMFREKSRLHISAPWGRQWKGPCSLEPRGDLSTGPRATSPQSSPPDLGSF